MSLGCIPNPWRVDRMQAPETRRPDSNLPLPLTSLLRACFSLSSAEVPVLSSQLVNRLNEIMPYPLGFSW